MRKFKAKIIGAFAIALALIAGNAVKVEAAHSQFFTFNQEVIPYCGYADNLLLIQNSMGEFNAEDIQWMARNDCLDETGLAWCYDAGLMDIEGFARMIPYVSHTKPQAIFGH